MRHPEINRALTADAEDLEAYNAAFYELGLRWSWDADRYDALRVHPEMKDNVRTYLETEQAHLLKAYDADFLVEVIQSTQARCRRERAARGAQSRACRVDWAAMQRLEVGV